MTRPAGSRNKPKSREWLLNELKRFEGEQPAAETTEEAGAAPGVGVFKMKTPEPRQTTPEPETTPENNELNTCGACWQQIPGKPSACPRCGATLNWSD